MGGPPKVGESSDRLVLRYGEVAVGEITDLSRCVETWFGVFRPTLTTPSGPVGRRILDSISFCRGWNARSYADEDADASEFDRFDDLTATGLWSTQSPDGGIDEIDKAPVFHGGERGVDVISWMYRTS
jgi:hypothetical protein